MNAIRFIHAADIHLDTKFSALPPGLGDRRRAGLRERFTELLDRGVAAEVDFALLAGDLFEHEHVTPDTASYLAQALEEFGRPVFIAPGNHDPLLTGSPYLTRSWPANVWIFRERAARAIEDLGVVVHGFGHTTLTPEHNPFHDWTAPRDGRVHLLVGHGSDLDRVPPGKRTWGPFRKGDLVGRGFAYVALGHYHRAYEVAPEDPETRIWYPGSLEARGFDEEGEHGCLFGAIDDDGVAVERWILDRVRYGTWALDCREIDNSTALAERAAEALALDDDEGRAWIARLRLIGERHPDLAMRPEALAEALRARVPALMHLSVRDETLASFDLEGIRREERTTRALFLRAIEERLAAAGQASEEASGDASGDASDDRALLAGARDAGLRALAGRRPLEL